MCILIPVQIHLLILEAEQHLGMDTVLQGGLQSVSKSLECLLISTHLQLGSRFCLGTAGASLFPVMSHWGLRNPLCPPQVASQLSEQTSQMIAPSSFCLVTSRFPLSSSMGSGSFPIPTLPSTLTHLHQANLGCQIPTQQSHLTLTDQNLRRAVFYQYFKKKSNTGTRLDFKSSVLWITSVRRRLILHEA